MSRRRLLKSLATGLLVAVSTGQAAGPAPAQVDKWPDRPIKMVVPYAAGGATDATARPWADKLTQAFGQQFVVENRGGASGMIGLEAVAKLPGFEEAGADIVRVSCPDEESTAAFSKIAREAKVPLVADIHFHYRRAIEAAVAGAAVGHEPGHLQAQATLFGPEPGQSAVRLVATEQGRQRGASGLPALVAARRIGAKRTYFIHMCDALDHAKTEEELPEDIRLTYDGMILDIP